MTHTIPRLHVITDDAVLARPHFADTAAQLLERCRADLALHIRGHQTTGAKLYAITEQLIEPARRAHSSLFINDRVDIALALNTDGVQLGEFSMNAEDARKLLPPETWIGLSAHSAPSAPSAPSAREANPPAPASGADLIILGTIWESRSHPGRPAGGIALLKQAVSHATIPVIAIGGITPARVKEVAGAGAYGVAVLGGVWNAADAAEAAAAYVEEVHRAWRSTEVSL